MKRTFRVVICLCAAAGVMTGSARAELRNPTPEQVAVAASIGGFRPVGRFGDKVNGGGAVGASGFYRLTRFITPAFAVHYAFLDPDESATGIRGSIDTWSVLGGVRLFLFPESYRLRPWVAVLGGWAHYTSYRVLPLETIFTPGRNTRDDPVVSAGGGIDLGLHPNFTVGADIRDNVSLTDDHEKGERDLTAITILGSLIFHY